MKTIPYFYIIQHKESKIKYCGSRTAKGCDPVELLKINGYLTSSKKVNNIIKREGIQSFDIIDIVVFDDIKSCMSYEKEFQVKNNCASDKMWYNGHNGFINPPNSQQFRDSMLKIYGVDNAVKSPEIYNKIKQTCLKNHGVEYPMQSDTVKEKSKQTCIENYGVDHHMKSPEYLEWHKKHLLETTGYENPSFNPEVKQKISESHKKLSKLMNIYTKEIKTFTIDSNEYRSIDKSVWKNHQYGTKWMRDPKTGIEKMVSLDKQEEYLKLGYIFGKAPQSKEHKNKRTQSRNKTLSERKEKGLPIFNYSNPSSSLSHLF